MSSRKVRGRLKSLSHTGHRAKKRQHDERTNRPGKLWAKKHVEREKIGLEENRKRHDEDRKRRKRLKKQGVDLP